MAIKGVALTFTFSMVDSTTGLLKTTLSAGDITARFSKNGANYVATTNAPLITNIAGIFKILLTADETNTDELSFLATAADCRATILNYSMQTNLTGVEAKVNSIKSKTDLMAFVGFDIKATLDSEIALADVIRVDGTDITLASEFLADVVKVGGSEITNVDDFKANVSGLSTFDAATDKVIVATNEDKVGYSISGTKKTLDQLNDVTVANILAGVIDGSITLGAALKNIHAFARGKVVIVDNAIKYYATDGTTLLFTLTISASGRTIA